MAPSACYPNRAENVNSVLEILANDLRREIIYYFECISETDIVSVSTVLSHLDDETSGHDAKQLNIQLVHTHLPKLDKLGWIDYDAQRGSIRYHGHDSAHRHLSDLCAMFE